MQQITDIGINNCLIGIIFRKHRRQIPFVLMIIQQLKLSSNVVFLEGMSLRGDFVLMNPNQIIAVSYFIDTIGPEKIPDPESRDTEPILSSKLSIFPKSGLLLKGQSQKITIRAKNHEEFKDETQMEDSIKVCLKCSLNNNFNKILIKNRKITDLSQQKLISYQKLLTVHIEIGTDHLRLKNDIENEVLFGSSLGKETANISMIQSNVNQRKEDCEDCEQVCTIFENLSLNSKLKSGFEKQTGQALEDREPQNRYEISVKEGTPRDVRPQNDQLKIQLQSAQDLAFSSTFADFTPSARPGRQQNRVSSLQLILLAILAGFFYSLGSNIKQLQQ